MAICNCTFIQFALAMLISMIIYAALASSTADNWNKQLALMRDHLLQVDEGQNTTTSSFQPLDSDAIASAIASKLFTTSYSVAVTIAIIDALTFVASLLYIVLLCRIPTSTSVNVGMNEIVSPYQD